MMKNRSFLLGLGSGLIAGALLLQVMISGNAAPLTQEQVLKGAALLNLKVSDASGKLLTAGDPVAEEKNGAESGQASDAVKNAQGGTNTDKVEASPSPSAPGTASPPSPAASPKAPGDAKATDPSVPVKPSAPAKEAVEQPKATDAPTTPEPPVAVITVRIPSGVNLNKTADLLAQAGAISDKEAFLKSAKERKINTKIQYGTYSFEKGESIDSIIQKLVTVKK